MNQTQTVEEAFLSHGAQIGALARALAIVVGSLDQAGVINGRAIAASMRLDSDNSVEADDLTHATADLICRIIDQTELDGPAGPRAVE